MAEVLRPPTPAGGWARPWPDVAELAAVCRLTTWTLIGGLMVQLHAIAAGLPVVRPTNDVDVLCTSRRAAAGPPRSPAAWSSWGTSWGRASIHARVRRTASSAKAVVDS